VVTISVLLQLPLRRVSEYHDAVERIQLQLEVTIFLNIFAKMFCLSHQLRPTKTNQTKGLLIYDTGIIMTV